MTNDALRIHTIATPGLGDRSYIAILDGWAVAVDVRDLDRVEEIIADEKASLGAVIETHIHNDYLTGGLVPAPPSSAVRRARRATTRVLRDPR